MYMNGRLHKFLPGRRNDIGDDILISLWLDYALFEEIETKRVDRSIEQR